MAYEQEPGRGQTAFGKVLEARGLIGVIKNPKLATKDIKDIKRQELKDQLASKTSPSNTFYSIQKVPRKYEKIQGVKTLVDVGGYDRVGENPTLGEAGRQEVYRQRLDKKETKEYLKSKRGGEDKYRPWFEMREAVKETRPLFKGPDTTKRMKTMWKEQAGDKTLGVKNKIKLSYGFGKAPDELAKAFKAEYQAKKSGGGITGPGQAPGAGRNQSFCTAKGVCRQVNP